MTPQTAADIERDEATAREMSRRHCAEWRTAEAAAAARDAYVDAAMRRTQADSAARYAAAGNYRAAESADFVAAAVYAAAAEYQARYVAGGAS